MTSEKPRTEPAVSELLQELGLWGSRIERRTIEAAYKRGWNDALTTAIAELHTMQMEVAEQLIGRLAKLPTPSEGTGEKP